MRELMKIKVLIACLVSSIILTGCSNTTQVSATKFKSLYKSQTMGAMLVLEYKGIKEEMVIIEQWKMNILSSLSKTKTFWALKSEFDSEYIAQIEKDRIEKEKAHAKWIKTQKNNSNISN